MSRYTNNYELPLSLAIWLLDDGYDYDAVADPNTYSVTEIIKPIRQIVLGRRVNALPPDQQTPTEIMSLFNARVGQSVHTAIENAWMSDKLPELLSHLGISKHVGKKIEINPDPTNSDPEAYKLYMEQRRTIKINDIFSLTGQYDFNFTGQLQDFKFTKTYALTMGVNDDYYIKQGSLYKHIFPDQITSNTTRISFMFGDWMASRTGQPGYPVVPIASKEFPLMSPFKTSIFIEDKFADIAKYRDLPENLLPLCTPDDLWKDPDVYKYYKNAQSSRSTKNYDNASDANAHLIRDKGVGVVKTVVGKIKACKYCKAFPLCKQKDQYLLAGSLDI